MTDRQVTLRVLTLGIVGALSVFIVGIWGFRTFPSPISREAVVHLSSEQRDLLRHCEGADSKFNHVVLGVWEEENAIAFRGKHEGVELEKVRPRSRNEQGILVHEYQVTVDCREFLRSIGRQVE